MVMFYDLTIAKLQFAIDKQVLWFSILLIDS